MKKTTILEMNRLTVEEFHEAEKMPLIVVLDDVRSLHNVGSVFRTADAFRVEEILLCGITATPAPLPDGEGERHWTLKASQEIHKTALGAEESVAWRYFSTAMEAVEWLKIQVTRCWRWSRRTAPRCYRISIPLLLLTPPLRVMPLS